MSQPNRTCFRVVVDKFGDIWLEHKGQALCPVGTLPMWALRADEELKEKIALMLILDRMWEYGWRVGCNEDEIYLILGANPERGQRL